MRVVAGHVADPGVWSSSPLPGKRPRVLRNQEIVDARVEVAALGLCTPSVIGGDVRYLPAGEDRQRIRGPDANRLSARVIVRAGYPPVAQHRGPDPMGKVSLALAERKVV